MKAEVKIELKSQGDFDLHTLMKVITAFVGADVTYSSLFIVGTGTTQQGEIEFTTNETRQQDNS